MGIRIVGEKRYVYRSVRVGPKVTSRYMGKGDEACHRLDLLKRLSRERPMPTDPERFAVWYQRQVEGERKEIERDIRRKFVKAKRRAEAIEGRVKALAVETKELARCAMLDAGFHTHHRTWRRKRGAAVKSDLPSLNGFLAMIGVPSDLPPPTPEAIEEVRFLRSPEGVRQTVDKWEEYDRTRGVGKPSVMDSMKQLFRTDPVREVVETLVCRQSNEDITREITRRQYARIRDELIGPNPTTVERLIAERAALCWLDAHVADQRAMRVDGLASFTVAEAEFFDRVRDRAHRRYVQTLQALHTVRARAIPALRLSLAVQGQHCGAAAVATVEASDSAPQVAAEVDRPGLPA